MIVLVLDQSLTVRMDVARILIKEGHHVHPCGSAVQARAILAEGGIDLAVLDVAPESGGLDILDGLCTGDHPAIPVLLLIGDEDAARDAVTLACGAHRSIRKPYLDRDVVAAVTAMRPQPSVAVRPRALLVDDSETFNALICEALCPLLDVHPVKSGEEALAYLATNTVDVVLLDRGLPGLSGEEVCRAIRADPRTRAIPVLMLTGSVNDEAVVSCLDAGADDFVTKSADLRVLTSRLSSQLRRREADEQTAQARIARNEAKASQVLAETRAAMLADLACKNQVLEVALTEQRQAEDALRLSDGFNRTVLASIPDCVQVLDPEGRLQAMSENGQRMMEIDDFASHRGIEWSGLWQGEDRVAALAALAQARESGLGQFQGLLPTMRGVAKWWDVRLAPVHGADGQIVQLIAVARDRTDQRGNEKTLARQRVELERSNGELEYFAAIAAHDMKEPLRMVTNYLGLIERKYANLDVKMSGYIAQARDGAERMGKLLDGLLTYAHVASAQEQPHAVSASRAFDEAVSNLSTSIAERHAHVTRHELPRINVNHEQMVQLLQNLIANAIKFCRDRVPEVSVTAKSENQETTFRVTDNGIGIDAAQHVQIFSMFKRLNTRSEFSGSGIGLATCKRIVDRHGGRLWVESNPGSGSTFCFTLASSDPIA